MKNLSVVSIVLIILFNYSCKSPFNTNINEGDVLELNVSHNISRVMPTGLVELSWSEITIENFKSIRLERKVHNDTSWTLINELIDPFITTYIDTISDDENILYRVGIVNSDEDIVWAEKSITIPATTSTVVPREFPTVQPAIDSDLIDNGDTIFVNPGIYVETLGISGKNILIKSYDGYRTTILQPSLISDPNLSKRVLFIASGVLDGFTIELGRPSHAQNGGGVSIAQNGTVMNCFISENETIGAGGGVYITDEGNLYNCIVTGDTASIGTGIYISNCHGNIINNTFVNNSLKGDEVVINGDCDGLVFRNNIILNPTANEDVRFINEGDSIGVIIDYLLLDNPISFGNDIIVGEPEFVNNIEYELLPTSLGVHAGHPSDEYLNRDGTRNDIGAYGGPFNNK